LARAAAARAAADWLVRSGDALNGPAADQVVADFGHGGKRGARRSGAGLGQGNRLKPLVALSRLLEVAGQLEGRRELSRGKLLGQQIGSFGNRLAG
jgi:hypothetical protein